MHDAKVTDDARAGEIMRAPAPDVLDTTAIGHYVRWLATDRGLEFADHPALWRWSIEHLEEFWASIWDHFEIRAERGEVLASQQMPGAKWFPGTRLNYAEHMLPADPTDGADELAVIAHSQTREPIELTYRQLREQVARARAGLQRLGVGPGDRVVAYLPNIPETLIGFMAAASLGVVWASCAPEFGARSVIDRFAQIEPTVLFAVAGYTYGAKVIDKSAELAAIRAGLPTLRHVVGVPYGEHEVPDATSWDALLAETAPLKFVHVPFDEPLCVLFSSGTTGLPKAIVHGHGGLLVEHLKKQAFNLDTQRGDRFLWFTTTAWTLWNTVASALLCRAAVVLHDGNPLHPDHTAQWRLAEATSATLIGTSPAYLMACRSQGVDPGELPALRMLGVTGSPLPAEGFDWVQERFGNAVLLNPLSGGTDVCTGFVSGSPWLPVRRGEIAGPCLGVDVTAFDASGHEVLGELGELVVRRPMPSMPLRFWGDDDGSRYRSSYFDTFPGIWRHGDWVRFSEERGCVITGRSDATLNRGGVRLGTAEFYAVVEELPEVADSLVVHLEDAGGGPGELILFVALTPGATLDDVLRSRIRSALRVQLSPRHIPDRIEVVPAVPRTLTGKKLETPIKQVLRGRPATEVISPDAVSNYAAVAAFAASASTPAGPLS